MANTEKGGRHETSKKNPDHDCAKNDNWALSNAEAKARNRELGKAQAMRELDQSTMHVRDAGNLGKRVVTRPDPRSVARAKRAQKNRAEPRLVIPLHGHRRRELRSGRDKPSRAAP